MKKSERQLKAVAKQLQSLALKVDQLAGLAAKAGPVKVKPRAKAKKATQKTAGRKAAVNKATARKAPVKRVVSKKAAAKKSTVLNTVFNVIKKSKKGISITNIKKRSGLETRQLSNALYKLTKKGMIRPESRGMYILS